MEALNTVGTDPLRQIYIEAALFDLGVTRLNEIAERVMVLDHWLIHIDLLLDRLQPQHSGRIRIHFETARSGLRTPVPKVWNWMRLSKEWRAKRVGGARLAMRAKTARGFHQNHMVVKELLSAVTELMRVRSSLVSTVLALKIAGDPRVAAATARTEEFAKTVCKIQTAVQAGKHQVDFSAWYRERNEV